MTLISQSIIMSIQALVKQQLELSELNTMTDAVELFARLASRSGCSVRLHCSVPMWSPFSDTCHDLHELNDLRSKSLCFIHNLLESLHSNGISASYRLAPSNSPLCFICAFPTELSVPTLRSATVEILQKAKINARQKVLLADLEHGPALIIS
ncbi:hypothetical protein SCLCIDRAFT_1211421 [Scleroderma citrinum Foug A]|uniref:Uncharacterized protein n=1 Tax=Scleroderma citrinum Foug A TaxID=1036808 RepID=A0A0C2ZXM4_9AGAM|nr:hypothetical protein SCLCIDRAFT_1211421 [Scleroderma citrinum Foug A]